MSDIMTPEQLDAALDAIAPVSRASDHVTADIRVQRDRIRASHEALREEVLAARDVMAMLEGWLRRRATR